MLCANGESTSRFCKSEDAPSLQALTDVNSARRLLHAGAAAAASTRCIVQAALPLRPCNM